VENLQREDLAILDEALGMKKLVNDYGKTQTQAAQVIGKTQGHVSQMLKILNLPKKIIDEIPKVNPSKDFLFDLTKLDEFEALEKWDAFKKGKISPKDVKPKKPKPKTKPFTWQPADKAFSISIKFKKENPDRQELIKALKQVIKDLEDE
jgi:ParB-like chromosome segregation protein Spo0J